MNILVYSTAPSSTLIHKCSFSEKEDSTNLSSLKETKKSVKAEKENAVKNETEHGVKMGVIYEKAKLLSRVLIYYPNKGNAEIIQNFAEVNHFKFFEHFFP